MATLDELLAAIASSPEGPETLAIFDFDGTLIAGYSATALLREQIRRGDLSPTQVAELLTAMAGFALGNTGFSAMMTVAARFMQGLEEEAYLGVGRELYQKHIARRVYPESRALVKAHLARGHTVAVISSATPYQVEPAARDLGIEHILCTHLEVEDGKFTGAVIRPTCFGQGKVEAAEGLAYHVGGDLADAWFYSDSTDDLELLDHVGHPHALNPSDELERLAHNRDWPSTRFGSRGLPSVGQVVRSVAATGSMLGSFLAGLPIYALTGSRRDSINFTISTFADTASALIGLRLKVKGEQYLWSSRPCVFVFNHQSKADVVILAHLLRRDFASVGKQEIKTESPLIGRIMEYAGVVFIDRSNPRAAIRSVNALVDVMHTEGKSVVMAPEGTRTVSPTLARFKKGAFHVAMQAKVPIIPIVIHNAGDVAPKGEFVYRPATVKVEVLPPVDTTQWRRHSVDEHVREVRNMYLAALGQPLEPAPQAEKPAAPTTSKTQATAPAKADAPPKTRAQRKPRAAPEAKPAAKTKAKAKAASKATAVTKAKAPSKTKTAPRKAVSRAKPKSKAKVTNTP